MVTKQHGLVIGLIVIALLFIMIGHIWRDAIQKPLQTEILTVGNVKFDGWSVSHFLLYSLLGYIMPNHFAGFLLLGVSWEVFEDYLASDKQTGLVDCCNQPDGQKVWCNGIQNDYWYGKWDDILMNVLGYLVGSAIKNNMKS